MLTLPRTSANPYTGSGGIVHVAHQQTLAFQVAPNPLAEAVDEGFQFGPIGGLHPLETRSAVAIRIHANF